MHFGFPQRILRVPHGYFEHQRRVLFEGCVADPLQIITAILLGSKWSVLLLKMVMQDAMSEVLKVYPTLRLKLHEVLRAVPKVVKKLKPVIKEAKLQWNKSLNAVEEHKGDISEEVHEDEDELHAWCLLEGSENEQWQEVTSKKSKLN